MADLMADMIPDLINTMPNVSRYDADVVKSPLPERADDIHDELHDAGIFPKLMRTSCQSDAQNAGESREAITMPDYLAEQMPDLMPKTMDVLMPKMLKEIIPYFMPHMVEYLRTAKEI
jgi:hypothetical protein